MPRLSPQGTSQTIFTCESAGQLRGIVNSQGAVARQQAQQQRAAPEGGSTPGGADLAQ